MNPIRQSLETIKKRNKTPYLILAVIFLLLFTMSFFSGQYLYKTDKQKAEDLVKQIAESKKTIIILNFFDNKNYLAAISSIFANNFLINAASMYLGVIVIIPILVFLSNASSLGMIFGIQSMIKPITFPYILFVLAVGILEISCLILTTYEGLKIAKSWIRPAKNENLKKSLKEATNLLLLIAIIFLIAAIIETAGIAIFSSRLAS